MKDYEGKKTKADVDLVNSWKNIPGGKLKEKIESSQEFVDEEGAKMENDVSYLEDNLAILREIREDVETREEHLCKDLTEKLETVKKLRESILEQQLGTRNYGKHSENTMYKYLNFFSCKGILWAKWGVQKDLAINLPKEIDDFQKEPLMELSNIRHASDVRCKGKISVM